MKKKFKKWKDSHSWYQSMLTELEKQLESDKEASQSLTKCTPIPLKYFRSLGH